MIGPALERVVRCPGCGGELDGMRCVGCGTAYRRDGDLLGLIAPHSAPSEHAAFYNETDEAQRFGRDAEAMDPNADRWVREFLSGLAPDALVLEVGAGQGAFSGVHPGLVQSDISWTALDSFAEGPRVQADAMALPFADAAFDAVYSVFAIEHVPEPERALREIDRVLRPGGSALLYPAWLVRPWAANALDLQPLRSLDGRDRLVKLTIPLRDSKPWRFARILPGRVRRELQLARGRRGLGFDFRPLQPNLEEYLAPDSDAFNSMDPEAMSAWFISRGYADLRRPGARQRLFYMYEPVHVRKPA